MLSPLVLLLQEQTETMWLCRPEPEHGSGSEFNLFRIRKSLNILSAQKERKLSTRDTSENNITEGRTARGTKDGSSHEDMQLHHSRPTQLLSEEPSEDQRCLVGAEEHKRPRVPVDSEK